MKNLLLSFLLFCVSQMAKAQHFECGIESVIGVAKTSFKADLGSLVGFSSLEISESDIDSAFASLEIDAPRWIKELFPGISIEIDEQIERKVNRVIKGVRFFARYRFVGGSFTISDPYLTEPQSSKKFKNQFKSVRLSLNGDAEGLAEHIARMALADANRVEPFFNNRFDLAVHADLKQAILGNAPLMEWGSRGGTIDASCLGGVRFTADPSAVVDLGSILFVSEKLDSLMEGGLLDPVEEITDAVAEAVQNIVFGKFRDPRVVPSMGWFIRPTVMVDFGGSFSVVFGGEISIQKHLTVKGTKPMNSIYGFTGLRWCVFGDKK